MEALDKGKKHAHYFFFFILFLVIFACYNIIKPYLNPIIIAFILSTVSSPINRKIKVRLKNRRTISAIASCILLTFIVVIPFTIVLIALINQAVDFFIATNMWIKQGHLNELMVSIKSFFTNYTPDISVVIPGFDLSKIDLESIGLNAGKKSAEFMMNYGQQFAGNMIAFFGSFCLMIFSFFFFVRDEEEISKYVLHLIPLSTSHEDEILDKVKSVSKSVLLGTFVTAIAQGLAGCFAFFIADLPWLFWGVMMAFASLVPVVGTALIWIPSTIFLAATGHIWMSVFVFIWCVIVVGGLDNIVRPIFMKGSAKMSTFLVFFSILGGISYFGMIGLIYGPLLFGLLMVLLYIYNLEFEQFLSSQDGN